MSGGDGGGDQRSGYEPMANANNNQLIRHKYILDNPEYEMLVTYSEVLMLGI